MIKHTGLRVKGKKDERSKKASLIKIKKIYPEELSLQCTGH